MQNPHLKVKRTGAIWLPKAQYGNAKLEWIEPFETSQVMLMLDAYRFGGEFEPIVSMVKAEPLPIPVAQIEQHIGNCIAMQKTLDTYLKELKAELLAKMVEADVQAYKGSHLSITIKKGYTRQGGYDADKLIAAIRELAPEKADEIINGSKKADTAVADSLLLKFK